MGDGRWEDGAHSLDQLSSEATEAEVTEAPASTLLLSQVSGLYPRLLEPKHMVGEINNTLHLYTIYYMTIYCILKDALPKKYRMAQ